MATHSRILAWRTPWTEEPGGLQSIGSHRVRHDRSNLAHSTHTRLTKSRQENRADKLVYFTLERYHLGLPQIIHSCLGAIERAKSIELGTPRQNVDSLCDQAHVMYKLSFLICEVENFHFHLRSKTKKPTLISKLRAI